MQDGATFQDRRVLVRADMHGTAVCDGDREPGDPATLPIPPDLAAALTAWGDRYRAENGPWGKAWNNPLFLLEPYALQGLRLARELKAALPGWTVSYSDEACEQFLDEWNGPHLHEVASAAPPLPPPDPWRVEYYDTLPSTSDLCTARAAAGEPGFLAVLARHQSAGRGSRGRTWDTPGGNLALSVLLRPGGPATHAGQWALAAAVVLRQALAAFAGPGPEIKWPNDVLVGGRKLAGLLVDAAAAPGGTLDWVVLGMGANTGAAPPGGDPANPASLPFALRLHDPGPRGTAATYTSDQVTAVVLDRLSTVLRILHGGGWPAIHRLWLANAHPVGTPLHVRSPRHDAHGTFAGLTPEGALLLATPDGVRAFPTGEVLLA